jgi:hypothetical protein
MCLGLGRLEESYERTILAVRAVYLEVHHTFHQESAVSHRPLNNAIDCGHSSETRLQ